MEEKFHLMTAKLQILSIKGSGKKDRGDTREICEEAKVHHIALKN